MNQANKAKFSLGASTPQFCIITPTAYLDKYAVQSTTHLVLAHLVDHDPVYAAFYKTRSEAGDRLIMDCSAFELGESYAPDQLVRLGEKCGAHALVLPDYPFEPADKTINAAVSLIPQVKEAGFATFFVPQSRRGDIEDWIAAYEWASQNPDIDIIGMSVLGIPNAIPHIPVAYARVVMSAILEDRGIIADKHHHFLGANAGLNTEVPALLEMGVLDTMDSSNPVWMGINGHRYNDMCTDWVSIKKKYVRHVDFAEAWTDKPHIHDIIQYNLDLTLRMFASPSQYL